MSKILIIDDDVNALKLLGYTLRKAGYEILVAQNGFEGIDKAVAHQPDLIVSDLMMPRMDGYEVTRQIRSNPATQHTPIIMLTAKSQVQDKVAGFEAGANDYVTKPVMPAELIARIKAQLATVQSSVASTQAKAVQASARIISFIGAKGGVGTSTLVVNLGIALQKSGKKVTLVDFQSASGTISQQLGHASNNNLFNLLKDASTITPDTLGRAITTHKSGLTLLPPLHGVYARYQPISPKQANSILDIVENGKDYILVDLGSALNQTATTVLKRSHLSCIVSEPNIIAMDLTRRALQYFSDVGMSTDKIGAIIVNRSRTGHGFTMAQLKELLNTEVWSVISPAPELSHQALQSKKPLIELQPQHLVAQQIQNLIPILSQV